MSTLARTPLHALHVELGARMVPFAGYAMPVQYPAGVLAEHKHTRAAAGLFDVSHMGQVELRGADAAKALEALAPGDILGLAAGRTRYTLFTNATGGILDDLMVTNADDRLFLVVNAACKDADIAHLRAGLAKSVAVELLPDRGLLALQGPQAERVIDRLAPGAAAMGFMSARPLHIAGIPCFVTRSGYTGEDGYEISVPGDRAEALARRILAEPEVAPVGLGARDTLRLEAGLCLYGSDIGTATTPVEAALTWTISKRRREQGGFPARCGDPPSDGRGTVPPARRPEARRPGAGARPYADRRRGRSAGRRSHQRRFRTHASTDRSPWVMCAPILPGGHGARIDGARQRAARRAWCRCPSSPTVTASHEQGSTMSETYFTKEQSGSR